VDLTSLTDAQLSEQIDLAVRQRNEAQHPKIHAACREAIAELRAEHDRRTTAAFGG